MVGKKPVRGGIPRRQAAGIEKQQAAGRETSDLRPERNEVVSPTEATFFDIYFSGSPGPDPVQDMAGDRDDQDSSGPALWSSQPSVGGRPVTRVTTQSGQGRTGALRELQGGPGPP